MSNSALISALGLGRQSAKDVAASTYLFPPVTSIGLNPAQTAQTLPPEIGGDYFLRGSYKATVMGSGDAAFVVRPNSIGLFLYMLMGQDTVTPVGGQSGAYSHAFTPFTPGAGVDLPWFTALKDVSKLYGEQYLNTKLRDFRLDVPKSTIATASASLIATTPSAVSVVSGSPSTINGINEVFDSSPPFQTSIASVTIATESPSPSVTFQSKVERFSFDFGNSMSEDEFSVGSTSLDDITLLQKTAQLSMDIVVRDTSWYRAVYYNGAALPSAWNSAIYRGAITVVLNSSSNVPTTTQPYQLTLTFPGLDFLMMPVSPAGAEVIRATISTQVTLGPSGSDRYSATLINGVSSY